MILVIDNLSVRSIIWVKMKWNEVKIFISSTFNDMHAERDYLITEVFPELNEWCEKRRIRLSDIDLRWGVTKEDSESGNTIKACLDCIDECRPFFLCFLGQRRGWVPDLNSGIDESTFEKYKGLKDKIGSYSITEMEIEHAALTPLYYVADKYSDDDQKKYALFFFRNNPFSGGLFRNNILSDDQKKVYTNAGADDEKNQDEKLQEFKDRISVNQNVYLYDCKWNKNVITEELTDQGDVCKGKLVDFTYKNKPLKEIIIAELKKRISEEFPENVETPVTDKYSEDAAEQELYAQTSAFDFVDREEELKVLHEHDNNGKALYIYSREGYGKSALLSKYTAELKANNRKVLYRSCGITNKSSNENDLYLSLGHEADLFNANEEEKQGRYKELSEKFFLELKEKGYEILVLDGIDRLTDLKEIKAASRKIPEGFELIISADDQGSAEAFGFPYEAFELNGFEDEKNKDLLIDQYLLRTLKKLDKDQKQMIISCEGSVSPLYLRIILNELKNYGDFDTLEAKIASFGEDVISAFCETLNSIETEYKSDIKLFKEMIVLIALARDGLSEDELLRALELRGYKDKDVLSRIRILKRRIKQYMNHSNGRDGIYIRSFIKAIIKKYPELIEGCRKTLISVYKDNFVKHGRQIRNEWADIHGSGELLYQLEMLKDFNGIAEVINDPLLLEHIHPREYYSRYIHGSFFVADMNKEIWDRNEEGYSSNNRKMAELFAKKARENVRIINQKYPHPYRKKCDELRKKNDQSEFLEYRDLFYETTQFIKAAAAFERKALYGPKNKQELGEFRNEFSRFTKTTDFSETESFMSYLSNFGGDETGLSHQIEDLADDVSIEVSKTRKYLDSISFE